MIKFTQQQRKELENIRSLFDEMNKLTKNDITTTLTPGIDINHCIDLNDEYGASATLICTDYKNEDLNAFVEIVNSVIDEWYGDWNMAIDISNNTKLVKEKIDESNKLLGNLNKLKDKFCKNFDTSLKCIDNLVENFIWNCLSVDEFENSINELLVKNDDDKKKSDKKTIKELEESLKSIKDPKIKKKLIKQLQSNL